MLYLCFIVGYDHELYVRWSICVVEIYKMGLNNFVGFRLLAELKMWIYRAHLLRLLESNHGIIQISILTHSDV